MKWSTLTIANDLDNRSNNGKWYLDGWPLEILEIENIKVTWSFIVSTRNRYCRYFASYRPCSKELWIAEVRKIRDKTDRSFLKYDVFSFQL